MRPYLYRKQIKIDYGVQFSTDSILNDNLKKIQLKKDKKTQINSY
jgi:hypothetical protein